MTGLLSILYGLLSMPKIIEGYKRGGGARDVAGPKLSLVLIDLAGLALLSARRRGWPSSPQCQEAWLA
jgi:hypothetical protein